MSSRPAAGGGRWVEVDPARIERWVGGFAERHGAVGCVVEAYGLRLVAADGAVAECHVPFPPLPAVVPGAVPAQVLAEHAGRDRLVGVLLVRLGGYAAGVFSGAELLASKVDSRLVQGRTAAGGWSQQRFARRRADQARQVVRSAVEVAQRVLVPYADRLDALVLGGERRSAEAVLADPRVAALRPLVTERFLTVPDPRHAVLAATPALFRAIHVRVLDPPGSPPHSARSQQASARSQQAPAPSQRALPHQDHL